MRSGLGPQVWFSETGNARWRQPQQNRSKLLLTDRFGSRPQGARCSELLVWLEVDPARVAVELNRSIVQRQAWDQTTVGPGATLEIVQFVGGG